MFQRFGEGLGGERCGNRNAVGHGWAPDSFCLIFKTGQQPQIRHQRVGILVQLRHYACDGAQQIPNRLWLERAALVLAKQADPFRFLFGLRRENIISGVWQVRLSASSD